MRCWSTYDLALVFLLLRLSLLTLFFLHLARILSADLNCGEVSGCELELRDCNKDEGGEEQAGECGTQLRLTNLVEDRKGKLTWLRRCSSWVRLKEGETEHLKSMCGLAYSAG